MRRRRQIQGWIDIRTAGDVVPPIGGGAHPRLAAGHGALTQASPATAVEMDGPGPLTDSAGEGRCIRLSIGSASFLKNLEKTAVP